MRRKLYCFLFCYLLITTGCSFQTDKSSSHTELLSVPVTSEFKHAKPPEPFEQISMVTEKSGYALTGDARLFKTADGGKSWADLSPVDDAAEVSGTPAFCVFGDKTLWVASCSNSNVQIKKSTNAGASWEKSQINCGADCSGCGGSLSICFASQSDGFLLSSSPPACGLMNKVLYKTTDGGTHWLSMGALSKIDGYTTGMRFPSTETGYITCSYHGQKDFCVYMTEDSGKTWRNVVLPYPKEYASRTYGDSYYADVFLPAFYGNSAKMEVLFSQNGKQTAYFYSTIDKGATWEIKNISNLSMKQYCFIDESNGFGLDEAGTLYTSKNGGTLWREIPQ